MIKLAHIVLTSVAEKPTPEFNRCGYFSQVFHFLSPYNREAFPEINFYIFRHLTATDIEKHLIYITFCCTMIKLAHIVLTSVAEKPTPEFNRCGYFSQVFHFLSPYNREAFPEVILKTSSTFSPLSSATLLAITSMPYGEL